MAIERVKECLKAFGRDKDILELPESSATVELAAQALHTDPARIAKTLSFYDEGGCILLVTAGDQKVDSGKFKRLFGKKPKMLAFDEVEPLTGHKPGGVCPFANPEGVKVYLDQSLQLQLTECLSDGGSADAHLLADRHFLQFFMFLVFSA